MAAGTVDLSAINTNDPIRYKQLADIYNLLDATLQVPFSISDGAVVPDGSLGFTTVLTFTSTSFVEISPLLTVTFAHEFARNVLAILPVFVNITTVSTVIEIGMQVNGTLDPNSVIRLATNGVASGTQTPMNSNFLFSLFSDINHPFDSAPAPVGSYTIKPVIRIVSGAAGSVNVRIGRNTRLIVRDM